MISVSVKSNLAQLSKEIAEDQKRIRLSAAIALTKTAKAAQTAVKAEMKRVIDRPTPYALNSTFIKPANVAKLEATVGVKDEAYKGTPGFKFLGPQIHGGERSLKRFELAMMAKGLMPRNMYAVPGGAAKLDAYGNVSRGQIMQILSALGAAEMRSGYMANRTSGPMSRTPKKKKRNAPKFFVGRPGGGKLPMGVYQSFRFARGSAVKPILIFVKRPTYRAKLDMFGVIEKVAATEFDKQFAEQLAYKK